MITLFYPYLTLIMLAVSSDPNWAGRFSWNSFKVQHLVKAIGRISKGTRARNKGFVHPVKNRYKGIKQRCGKMYRYMLANQIKYGGI